MSYSDFWEDMLRTFKILVISVFVICIIASFVIFNLKKSGNQTEEIKENQCTCTCLGEHQYLNIR